MNTITWKIEQLRVKPQLGDHTNVVVEATWLCEARDEENNAAKSGIVTFSAPSENFMPIESLTEEAVLSWCYGSGLSKESVEESALQLLAQQSPQPVVVKLPWDA